MNGFGGSSRLVDTVMKTNSYQKRTESEDKRGTEVVGRLGHESVAKLGENTGRGGENCEESRLNPGVRDPGRDKPYQEGETNGDNQANNERPVCFKHDHVVTSN